jgi:hypothetical protein
MGALTQPAELKLVDKEHEVSKDQHHEITRDQIKFAHELAEERRRAWASAEANC